MVVTLDDLSSARYAFMFNLTPFFTAIIAYFYWGKRLSHREMISLLIGFLGFMPLVLVSSQQNINSVGFVSIPGLQLFMGTIAYAYGWIIVSDLVKNKGYSPFLVTGISFLSGGVATLLTSLVFETHNDIPAISNMRSFILYLFSIIFVSEILASNLYAYLLKKYSATFLAFAGFLYPIFSALLAWIILKERITYNFFISTVIVTAALYMFHVAEVAKKHRMMHRRDQ